MKRLHIILFIIFFVSYLPGLVMAREEMEYGRLREKMVEQQIRGRGIKDANVLAAMRAVPRHLFVSTELSASAYEDRPLSIGYGQTISQPYIVALMTELLEVKGNERVLEVGTGSGYQAAILARIVKEVYSVEIVQPLQERAKRLLNTLEYKNVFSTNDDGYFGWEAHGPYDAVVVTCASEFIPPPLIRQLKPGGRMCIPVGPPFKVQHLILIEKTKSGEVRSTIIASVRFVPLVREGRK